MRMFKMISGLFWGCVMFLMGLIGLGDVAKSPVSLWAWAFADKSATPAVMGAIAAAGSKRSMRLRIHAAMRLLGSVFSSIKSSLTQYWLFLIRGAWLSMIHIVVTKARTYWKMVETKAHYALTAGGIEMGATRTAFHGTASYCH